MKLCVRTAGVGVILLGLCLFSPGQGRAEVSVNITVPLPGPVMPAPPGLVVIPGSYVYYPPEAGVDIFFYHGYWYRPHRGGWYIASGYNGPWRGVAPRRVPRVLFDIPHDYRRGPSGYDRVPYHVVQRNWRTWEKERHWDHEGRGRGNRGEHRGWGENHGGGHGHGRRD